MLLCDLEEGQRQLRSGATYFIPSPPATGNTSVSVCRRILCGKALRSRFQGSVSRLPWTVQTNKKSRYPDVFRVHVCSCGIPCAELSYRDMLFLSTRCHGSEHLFLLYLCYYSAFSFILSSTLELPLRTLCVLLSCYASARFGGRREGCLQVSLQPACSIEWCINCDWKYSGFLGYCTLRSAVVLVPHYKLTFF